MPLSEQHRKLRGRNYALAGALLLFVLLLFVVSIVKLQGAA